MENVVRKAIMPNTELICVETDKFKSGVFSVHLLTQLKRENASGNALIPNVLRRGCASYPDMESLESALYALYGSGIWASNRMFGEVQCLGLYATFVDDKFLKDEDKLLEKMVSLTGEVLLSPAMRGGLFVEEYVESEKEKLCDQIRSQLNDKASYAYKRMREIMYEDENYGVFQLGSVEAVEKVTARELTEHYRHILGRSEIQMVYCGSAKPERVQAAVLEAFRNLPREASYDDAVTEVRVDVTESRYVKESLELTQGNLCVGFRLGETMYEPDYAAIAVFNAVYGGSVTSKLFANVREKLSLCYYANSQTDRSKGVMTVFSGIDFDKYDAALNEILEQLEAVKRGGFSEAELEGAKKYVVMAARSALDSPVSIENFYFRQAIDELDFSIEEYAGMLGAVTAEQVVKTAKSIKLDTVYFLMNEKAEG